MIFKWVLFNGFIRCYYKISNMLSLNVPLNILYCQCSGSWILLNSIHSGTFRKYTIGVIQVTLLRCKMKLKIISWSLYTVNWVSFVAIARWMWSTVVRWLSWWLRKLLHLNRDGILHPIQAYTRYDLYIKQSLFDNYTSSLFITPILGFSPNTNVCIII